MMLSRMIRITSRSGRRSLMRGSPGFHMSETAFQLDKNWLIYVLRPGTRLNQLPAQPPGFHSHLLHRRLMAER